MKYRNFLTSMRIPVLFLLFGFCLLDHAKAADGFRAAVVKIDITPKRPR
jgi:hypothetical protein